MPITARQFFEIVEKARAGIKPDNLDKPVQLSVSNPRWIHDIQSGEWGSDVSLIDFGVSDYGSGLVVRVMGG